ncbi:MAG: hypothetical protein WCO00_08860 [Rhodospirillaceae bacterium]
MAIKTERFDMRVSEEFLSIVDEWRRIQQDIPPRAEAIRRLVMQGLDAGFLSGIISKLGDGADSLFLEAGCSQEEVEKLKKRRATVPPLRNVVITKERLETSMGRMPEPTPLTVNNRAVRRAKKAADKP